MKTIKILIPIYNEEESLLFLRNRLTSIINKLTNYRIEVLFINDGSKDNSLKIIEGIRKKDNRFEYISFSRNFGKEIAIIAGLDYSRKSDAVIIMDADLQDDMILAENMLKYIINYVLENAPKEMEFFNNFVDKGLIDRLKHVANSEFGRVTYTEAIDILEKNNDKFEYKVSWGCDLQTEHERYLTEEVFKKPVFVTDYPKEIKSFYMKLNDDGKTVAAADLLVPGIGEIIGGSQREENYDKLLNRMKELNMPIENYEWYLDLRKYGSCVHSGFGLGFERAIMYLTGMQNIRDVIPFPRTPKNCEF